MSAIVYAASALLTVCLVYVGFQFAVGENSIRDQLFPSLAVSGALSAGFGSLLLDWIDRIRRFPPRPLTGAVRGSVVALLAHVIFGFFFIGHAVIISADSLNITIGRTISTIEEMLLASLFAAIFLPATLIVGATTGFCIEKRQNRAGA